MCIRCCRGAAPLYRLALFCCPIGPSQKTNSRTTSSGKVTAAMRHAAAAALSTALASAPAHATHSREIHAGGGWRGYRTRAHHARPLAVGDVMAAGWEGQMRRRLGMSFPFACLPIEPVPSGRWAVISLRSRGAVMKVQAIGWSHLKDIDLGTDR